RRELRRRQRVGLRRARARIGAARRPRARARGARRRAMRGRIGRVTTVRLPTVALTTLAVSASVAVLAHAAPGVDALLGRGGGRIAEYYRRAQNVICVEKSTVQPIGWNLTPDGFARVVESELHVE